MAKLTLIKTRLIGGVWEGQLKGLSDNETPDLQLTHGGDALDGLSCSKDETGKSWTVRAEIPADRIADGVQTFVIDHLESGETLASIALISGEVATDDLLAEVSLLRAELDMLKRAFRRHCLETS